VSTPERPGATAVPGELEDVPETYVLSADRWHLEDEAEFLRRSLEDAKSELEAGDLGRADYDALCRRDEARLGAVQAALGALDAEDQQEAEAEAEEERRAPRRRGRWLLAVGVAALVAGATLLAFDLASPRAPGQPITGSLKVDTAKQIEVQLAQASALLSENSTSATQEALTVYAHVLSEDPRQPQALAETGWLEWEAGLHSNDRPLRNEGTTLVKRSLAVEPDDYAAHLFLGTIDFEGAHDTAAAITQYQAFLAERPPAQLIASAAPFLRAAYSAADLALPAGVPPAAGG
jgi:cytochrome c-type biogenesis protein CcmH/NrfG